MILFFGTILCLSSVTLIAMFCDKGIMVVIATVIMYILSILLIRKGEEKLLHIEQKIEN